MKYEELVARVSEAMKRAKVSRQVGHVAFQFNVVGEAEGVFYLEIEDGRISVEPYEYYDRDLIIEATPDVIVEMIEGRLTPRAAYTNGQIRIHGDSRNLVLLPMGSESRGVCQNTGV